LEDIINFSKSGGLVPVIIQDINDNEVLMLGYMNKDAYNKTLKTGKVHYWSRSKNRIWEKGETSGHFQYVREMRVDCDNDTVLIKVEQAGGAACHEGYKSCFFRRIEKGKLITDRLKIFNPADKYGD